MKMRQYTGLIGICYLELFSLAVCSEKVYFIFSVFINIVFYYFLVRAP